MYGVSVRAAMRAEAFFAFQRCARDALRRKEHIAKLVPLGKRRRAALAQSGLDLVDLAEGLLHPLFRADNGGILLHGLTQIVAQVAERIRAEFRIRRKDAAYSAAFFPAIAPKTTVSVSALPARRFAPCSPPVTSPQA